MELAVSIDPDYPDSQYVERLFCEHLPEIYNVYLERTKNPVDSGRFSEIALSSFSWMKENGEAKTGKENWRGLVEALDNREGFPESILSTLETVGVLYGRPIVDCEGFQFKAYGINSDEFVRDASKAVLKDEIYREGYKVGLSGLDGQC